MLNAVLIGNPRSAHGRRLAELDLPGRWIEAPAVRAEDVAQADLLAIFGGDGTMMLTLTALLEQLPAETLPPIALLPFGTTNMNAGDLNRARTRAAAVASLQAALRGERLTCQRRPLVRIRDGAASRYGFFFGMGIIASVVERWNQGRKSGPLVNQLRSLWALVTGLRSASTNATEIRIDGTLHAVYGLLASTLETLLFGARPFWGPATQSALRLTWVTSDAPRLLRHAPAVLRGDSRLAAEPGYESLSASSVELEFNGPYIIDGELFPADQARLLVDQSPPLRWLAL